MKWIKWLDKEILIIHPNHYVYKPIAEVFKLIIKLEANDGA